MTQTWGMEPLLDTGGFRITFPDAQGDQLYLEFVPDVTNTSFDIRAGYVDGPGPVSATLNLS